MIEISCAASIHFISARLVVSVLLRGKTIIFGVKDTAERLVLFILEDVDIVMCAV